MFHLRKIIFYSKQTPPEKLIFLGGGVYNGIVHNKIGDFMRKIRRKREKRKKRIIIISVFLFLIIMTSGYAAFSTNITLHAKGNIKEPSRVIQSWDENSQTDFHSDYYKQNIVSITFLDNNNVPDNAAESWDVSEDGKGGVKAWVVPNSEDTTKYDLYIGAKDGVIANEDSSYLFSNFRELKEINFDNNYDTSNATNMRNMFSWCTNIETIDVSSFNTNNVTDMVNMFTMFDNNTGMVIENKLSNIIFGDNFDTSNVTNTFQMFAGCENLKEIAVEDWNTSKFYNVNSMFAFCKSLTSLDLSKWDTSNVTEMAWMFDGCENLNSLNLRGFNTSKVTNMYLMFYNCKSLTELNLCSFDTSNVTDMNGMFAFTTNLTEIIVGPNWTTENADTTNMFNNSNISQLTTGMC